MKTSELRKKSTAELEKFLEEEREVLRTLRFKHAGAELKNVREIGNTKRAIAKTFTILKETYRQKAMPKVWTSH